MIKTVEFRQVVVGDHIYNSRATDPAFHWCRVNAVRQVSHTYVMEGGGRTPGEAIQIDTSAFTTIGHPREAISIKRTEGSTSGY